MTRLFAVALSCLFLALAFVGVFLPGIPTVPFLLLAAWFAARGSQRLHRWLYDHPRLGKMLIDWERQGAISRTSKVLAVVMLGVSWLIMYQRLSSPWLLGVVTVLFLAIATFLVSRPEPR